MFRAKTWQNTFQVIIPCLWQNHNENLCISYLNVISHVYIGTIGHCPQCVAPALWPIYNLFSLYTLVV